MQSLCRQGVGGWPGGFPPPGRGLSNLQQGAVLGAGQCAEPALGLTEGSAVSQGLFHGGAIAQADRGQSLAARSPCAQLPPQPTSRLLGARAGLTEVPHRSVGCSGAVLSWWLLPAPWPSCSRCHPSSTQCRVFQVLGTLPQGDREVMCGARRGEQAACCVAELGSQALGGDGPRLSAAPALLTAQAGRKSQEMLWEGAGGLVRENLPSRLAPAGSH